MLVKVTRTYGGQEGRRVKAGTIFQVGGAAEDGGPLVIARERHQQLMRQRLVEDFKPAVAPGAKPDPDPISKPDPARRTRVEPDSRPPAPPRRARSAPAPAAPASRAAAKPTTRRRSRGPQPDAPGEPQPLARAQSGGQTGAPDASVSSSQAAPPQDSGTLQQRGTRRRGSAGSPLTTPGASSPGPTPSMPVTPDGGEPTSTPAGDSAAFD